MLFHLLYGLGADEVGFLRVFRYTSTRLLAAAITALLLSFVIGPWFIEKLKSRQIGETIREDGPQTHKKKAGTPTMGGSLILFCLVVATLLWCDLTSRLVWLALTVTVGFGAVGFADDYTKVAKKNKKGVSGKLRLLVESPGTMADRRGLTPSEERVFASLEPTSLASASEARAAAAQEVAS